jgi:uncharacterized protein YfaP (DUF2135 family)
VRLLWSDENDLDLHVTDPNGFEISWVPGTRTSPEGGTLDHDANHACETPTVTPVENIFWPASSAPAGQHTVRVTLYNRCGAAPQSSPFTVHTIVNGVTADFAGVVDTETRCNTCAECGTCTFVTTFTR